ncbi:MAG: endolytic transglycosylase MltG [Holosporales bacterium]|nr:endolytic transglycosylase MltG [Holosporales bacterium]
MFKALITSFVLLLGICFSLYETSNVADHSIFFTRDENIYDVIKKDKSFKVGLLFFIANSIDYIRRRMQTGEYIVHYNETAISVLQKVFNGNNITHKITIPEGLTTQMIVEILNKNDLLMGEIKEIPEEGSIMPSTYFYKFHDTKESIIIKMKNQMTQIISRIQRQNSTNLSMKEILILASIIEKEVKLEEELELVSSVFHNRLRKKMRLQSCPTVIYSISNGYGKINRKLTKEDTSFKGPFNTYRVAGLPPTPICCPGEKAINAAMNPKHTNFLYFVLSPDYKHHYFSIDYKTHNKRKKAIANTTNSN